MVTRRRRLRSRTVYVSGHRPSRYHDLSDCTGLNATQMAGDRIDSIPLGAAIARGLTPCRACDPPGALSVAPSQEAVR